MKRFYFLLISAAAVVAAIVLNASSSGSPGGKTGSPGDSGATCTQCHAGTATNHDGLISTNIPADGYLMGETYTISATIENAALVKAGFELTAEDANGNKIGTFSVNGDQVQLANGGKSVGHTSQGNTVTGGQKVWTFNWTAPDENVSPITFYTAINATNADGGTGGDMVVTSSETYSLNTISVENHESASIAVYPNPSADGYINIKDVKDQAIIVFDSQGKIVAKDFISNNSLQMSTASIPSGNYHIYFEKDKLTKKVVIL